MEVMEIKNQELPWLIFKVRKNNYAINTNKVISIMKMVDEFIEVPDNQSYIRGIINLRGDIIPLIDLKVLLKEKSNHDREAEFENTINKKILEIRQWVDTFVEKIDENKSFHEAGNSDESEFVKWLIESREKEKNLEYHLNKILNSVYTLFGYSKKYNDDIQDGKKLSRIDKKRLLFNMRDDCAEDIFSMMKESIALYHNIMQEMIIELEYEGMKAGIIVDKVDAIDNIEKELGQARLNPNMYATKFIEGVAKTAKTQQLVLLPKLAHLFDYAKTIDAPTLYNESSETIDDDYNNLILNEKELYDEPVEITEEEYEKILNGESLESSNE